MSVWKHDMLVVELNLDNLKPDSSTYQDSSSSTINTQKALIANHDKTCFVHVWLVHFLISCVTSSLCIMNLHVTMLFPKTSSVLHIACLWLRHVARCQKNNDRNKGMKNKVRDNVGDDKGWAVLSSIQRRININEGLEEKILKNAKCFLGDFSYVFSTDGNSSRSQWKSSMKEFNFIGNDWKGYYRQTAQSNEWMLNYLL